MADIDLTRTTDHSVAQPRRAATGRRRYRGRVAGFRRPVIDALTAFSAFAVVASCLAAQPLAASPFFAPSALSLPAPNGSPIAAVARDEAAPVVQIATTASSNSSNAIFRRTSDQAATMLLAVSFSLLAALNLAFFRHLRRVYVRPQRRQRVQQPSAQKQPI